jgi:hypothetical protein
VKGEREEREEEVFCFFPRGFCRTVKQQKEKSFSPFPRSQVSIALNFVERERERERDRERERERELRGGVFSLFCKTTVVFQGERKSGKKERERKKEE